jgi:predicted small lipoprotein YifL
MFKSLLISCLVSACLLVAGCGNKGPLYLPEPADPPNNTEPSKK